MKRESYISPKKVLSKNEYEEYRKYQEELARKKYRGKIIQSKRELSPYSKKTTSVIRAISQRGGITRSLYNRPNNFKQGNSIGRKGRPGGSYDPRYAKYGGVYGFRMFQAQQFRFQRMDALRRSTINPQQQAVLNQIEARNQQNNMNPENKIIPDTNGSFNLNNIFKDINDATNIFQ